MYRIIELLIGCNSLSPHFTINQGEVACPPPVMNYDRYNVIFGHLGTAWNDIISPGRRWMTILRDPVDRVISQYYYWRNCIPPSPNLPYVHAAQTLPLERFILLRTDEMLQGNENGQTWQLADDFRMRYRKVASRDALHVAKLHLVERFAFVGIFEDYVWSVRRLCDLFGAPLPDAIPRENRTPKRAFVHEIDPDVVAAIRELNTMDYELYEFGKKLVAELSRDCS